jgi:hypothetical protein
LYIDSSQFGVKNAKFQNPPDESGFFWASDAGRFSLMGHDLNCLSGAHCLLVNSLGVEKKSTVEGEEDVGVWVRVLTVSSDSCFCF